MFKETTSETTTTQLNASEIINLISNSNFSTNVQTILATILAQNNIPTDSALTLLNVLSSNQLSSSSQIQLLDILSGNQILPNTATSLINVLGNTNLSPTTQSNLINYASTTNLPSLSTSSLIQVLASNTLDPASTATLINTLTQPSIPLISQSSLINILSNNQNPATQLGLINILAVTSLQSQTALIDTLSAKNLVPSQQSTVINSISSANFSQNDLSSVLNILSNIILSPSNVLKMQSLLQNSTNITYIESVLGLISQTTYNGLLTTTLSQISSILTSQGGQFYGCLMNCSNNGDCEVENGSYTCFCRRNYEGVACQNIYNPCLIKQCLNDGICIIIPSALDPTTYDFTCNCSTYYNGSKCENKVDICQNKKCSGNGFCYDDNHVAKCACLQLYEGDNCEKASEVKKAVVTTQITATVLAAIIMTSIPILILLNDILNFFNVNTNKKIFKKINRKYQPEIHKFYYETKRANHVF